MRTTVAQPMLFAAVLFVFGTASLLHGGQIENMMSFQARLTDDLGQPLPDGTYTLDFFIWADAESLLPPIGSILDVPAEITGGNGVVSRPIGPVQESWFADAPRFISLTIDDNDDSPLGSELLPRIQLTAVPYAMRAFNLPTTTLLAVQSADVAGPLTVTGNVGIGTALPAARLHVFEHSNTEFAAIIRNGGGDGRGLLIHGSDGSASNPIPLLRVETNLDEERFVVTADGLTRVKTLHVTGNLGSATTPTAALYVHDATNTDYAAIIRNGGGDGRGLLIRASSGTGGSSVPLLRVETTRNEERLVVTEGGTTRVKMLQITGGSDLAEPFTMSSDPSTVTPGMVVAIDPGQPGNLTLASEAYDRKVAGVISGANGLSPGMVMSAEGHEHADGDHPVALTGRVWCWCDADANGPIGPGDRLTTSATPGHAMKVTDESRAPGAVIGKAMTGLPGGTGLVLVLVNLQ